MGAFNRHRVFDPLDLEIIDRVYETAWAHLEAREPFRDREKDDERREALRKKVLAFAICGKIDFDTLCDKVLPTMPQARSLSNRDSREQGQGGGGAI